MCHGKPTKNIIRIILYLLINLLLLTSNAHCVAPPDDPGQSINYWRSKIISAENNSARNNLLVEQAQNVFSVLLRAWDSTRIEPVLYIVDSDTTPWAASLADGNILMSYNAIQTINSFGNKRANHLLAFILAHELSHQRSDDLWHQRFFRMIDSKNKKQTLNKLNFNNSDFDNIVEKEIKADQASLLMMNSVGFDPFQVLDNIDRKDFFTLWVENIWKETCAKFSSSSSQQSDSTSDIVKICEQARSRALRARIQLTNVATQSMLYDIGVQSFVANNFIEARRYFSAYGRENSNRAILSATGLSYFAQAVSLKKELVNDQNRNNQVKVNFYYPYVLESSVNKNNAVKRSLNRATTQQLKNTIHQHIENSIRYFDKAIRLEPDYNTSYILLALSYLLDENTYMVRGILQGQYLPKFGDDAAVDLLLAMNNTIEGHFDKAMTLFEGLKKRIRHNNLTKSQSLSNDLIIYSTYYNSNALAKKQIKPELVAAQWQELATLSQHNGNAMLFQLALMHLKTDLSFQPVITNKPTINGKYLNDKFSSEDLSKHQYKINDLWIDGELNHVYRFDNGSRYIIAPNQKISSAWQTSGDLYFNDIKNKQLSFNDASDRPVSKFGIPDRRLFMMSGEYLAYDKHGIAIQIKQNKITGWFLYQRKE